MTSHLGRYEIVEELGRGAMGLVYKAKDPLIERFVAIKAINLQILPEKEKEAYKTRFYQEAKAAGHLNHPNIVTIHDMGESGDVAYIAMELMEGRELQVIMDGGRQLSVDDALNIAGQVAEGLSYAHQRGIVHRDIKPSNIMVLGDNHVKIADFGIARMSSSLTLTRAGMVIGSPLYMSPEQILGEATDARSDIFSLGIVLYNMLTGRLPFSGEDANSLMFQIVNTDPPKPSSLNPQVSDALDLIVSKCLAKKLDERYKNAKELAKDLRSYREKLLHAQAGGPDHPLVVDMRFKQLRRLVTPGAVSPDFVAVGSYIAMAVIFAFDMSTHTRVQMHMLYIFPLIMIGFHCDRIRLVNAAVILSLFLQGIMLMTDTNLSILAKLTLAVLVLPSNIMVAYVSRIARKNFMEVGNLASFDRLTGLRNRLSFESITDFEIIRQKQHGGVFSFALIDIDNLNDLNKARGYQVGDEVLKLLANVMREHIRQSDTVARLGGDEFAILMPNTDATDCQQLCKQLATNIALRMKEATLPISASIGYTTFERTPVSISEVFLKAENAMRLAQANAGSDHSGVSGESLGQ